MPQAGRAAFLIGLIALVGGCTPSSPGEARCSSDADCAAEQHCSLGGEQGVCITGARPCAASQPCPDGQWCCGGFCSQFFCCKADIECPDGYCDRGACRDGARSSCGPPPDYTCQSGRCLPTTNECVECLYNDDCEESIGLICSSDHRCVSGDVGCSPASCALEGLICSPAEGTCRACVSTSECGDKVCDGSSGLCRDCSSNPECGIGRICNGGSCANDPASTDCTSNADCGDQICGLVTNRCEPCILTSECGTGRVCTGGSCIAETAECLDDSGCAPPLRICTAGLCEDGCTTGGCAPGQTCSVSTGRCVVTSTGTLALGETCTAHSTCLSSVCWPLDDGLGNITSICGQSCVRHDDCPTGFVCYELGDGNLCLDKNANFPTLALDTPPGGACGGAFLNTDCMTGYCNTNRGECMEMCARDDDCLDLAGMICVSRWPVGTDADGNGFLTQSEIDGFAQLCHEPYGTLPAASLCAEHDTCESGYCAQTPDLTQVARCAEPCCTPADCSPASSVCKPIDVWDGIRDQVAEPYGFQKICLWREFVGSAEVGEVCSTDADCKSEICVAGASGIKRCTHTCCTNEDCAAYDWAESCRPPFFGTHALSDGNVTEMGASLGRQAVTLNGYYPAEAFTPFCVPR